MLCENNHRNVFIYRNFILTTLRQYARQFIIPAFCPFCHRYISDNEAIFCAECNTLITPIAPLLMHVTKKYEIPVHAIGAYKEPLKTLILAKTRSDRSACRLLADLMYKRTVLPFLTIDYLVSIPLHWTRLSSRGYNQAEVIAQYLSEKTDIPVINLIKRIKKTRLQASLSAEQRLISMVDAFEINDELAHLIANKNIMIVDDLLTTGSTLQAAAKIIVKVRPKKISAIVAARVI